MIIHDNTILSEDLFDKHFICDLNACKGACCIEGDAGAPVTDEEISILEEILPKLTAYLSPEGLNLISEKGVSELDKDGDAVTNCLPDGTCVFAVSNNGILSCGIENAFNAGAVDFIKPLSCNLYPIRVSKVGDYDALNYHKWDICSPACKLGEQHQVPIYKFLKTPLIRAYGQNWYNELDAIADALKDN